MNSYEVVVRKGDDLHKSSITVRPPVSPQAFDEIKGALGQPASANSDIETRFQFGRGLNSDQLRPKVETIADRLGGTAIGGDVPVLQQEHIFTVISEK